MATRKTTAKKPVTKEVKPTHGKEFTLPVFDVAGKESGKITVDSHIFGVKMNRQLLTQAVRVYEANQRQGTLSTKTRGEVIGSTRKIYRQKGTGRARHGGIRAPLFVGGGVAHGPTPRDFSLSFPQKMKQQALATALSLRKQEEKIHVISGLDKIEPKTKQAVSFLTNAGLLQHHTTSKRLSLLLVTTSDAHTLLRAARNIPQVSLTTVAQLNAYDVLRYRSIVFMQEAMELLKKRFGETKKKQTEKK